MIEVVVQLAVGVVVAGLQQIVYQFAVAGQLMAAFFVAGVAEVVAVEQAWVAVLAQQDQPIGQRLEPIVYPGLQRLAWLAVVVVYEGYRHQWVVLHERAVEQFGEVVFAASFGGLVELEVQRDVEESHGAVSGGEVFLDRSHAAGPVFPDTE
jgi:hypothetical protein